MTSVARYTRRIVEERGWTPGTTLENRVMHTLSWAGFRPAGAVAPPSGKGRRPYRTADEVVQQHRIGQYRVDFAWPDLKIALEADGWYHRSPEGAAKDAERDSWLRAQGWLVFRVDDRHGEEALDDQLCRVARLVRTLIVCDR